MSDKNRFRTSKLSPWKPAQAQGKGGIERVWYVLGRWGCSSYNSVPAVVTRTETLKILECQTPKALRTTQYQTSTKLRMG